MWDLKLIIVDSFFYLNFYLFELYFYLFNLFDPFLQNGLFLFSNTLYYQFPQNMTFFFTLKFCGAIAFLVFIRGGTPRYRYDYLTKLGWLKFLGFIILVFISSLLIFFLF